MYVRTVVLLRMGSPLLYSRCGKKFLAAARIDKTAVKHLTVDSIWTNWPMVPA